MHEVSTLGNAVIISVVVVVVLLLIMFVVVVDHKAKIPGGVRRDLFRITGIRRGHPIWSYVIGTILLTIITGVALELGATLLNYIPYTDREGPSALLTTLQKKSVNETARHFHNPANSLALEGKKSVCYYCHGDFPHFQRRMIRTLLNMHTQFIGCMTCHVNSEKINEKEVTLRWLNYSGIEVKGSHFGIDYDQQTGFLKETDDYYSKIVPYLSKSGTEKLLEITEDDPLAIDFVKVQDQLQGRDREAVKKSLHNLVKPKGRFCTRCHAQTEKSFIPFVKLGFTERRISDLTNMNIIGLVEKYKEFYMPDLMDRKIEPIHIESLKPGE